MNSSQVRGLSFLVSASAIFRAWIDTRGAAPDHKNPHAATATVKR
jgi:hypothetical protein